MFKRVVSAALGAVLTLLPVEAMSQKRRILFVGNSFTFGAHSAVWKYRAETVHDLNGDGTGGVPALFKRFADQLGLEYDVSVEASGGKSLRWHWENRKAVIDRPWDDVVLQDYSTLEREQPGNDASLVHYAGTLTDAFLKHSPSAKVRLVATWARADQTWRPDGHWYGRPITAMACDVAAGYRRAAARHPQITGVVPVGFAFDRAFATGIADPNPYDGIDVGRVSLWTHDHYHGSIYGYYLSALVIFGSVTDTDPLRLGPHELSARELGLSRDQATQLQTVAAEQLKAGDFNPRCPSAAPPQ